MSDNDSLPPSFWRELALDVSDLSKLLCVILVLPPVLTGTAAALIDWVRG